MRHLSKDALRDGVCTASAGNMAQGVAWCAREMGVSCRVIVPDRAPAAKTDAVRALGAEVIPVPFADWWKVMETHDTRGVPGAFIHPVENNHVIAGNGTIALEIVEDLPDVDTVVVPFGGGGLISGIGAGLQVIQPGCRVLAAEVATAAPLRASLDAGEPRAIERIPTFVDGIGGASVLPAMWPLVRQVVTDSIVVSLEEIADAIRVLVRQARIVAEGAGAAPVAVVQSGSRWGTARRLRRVRRKPRSVSPGDHPPGLVAEALVLGAIRRRATPPPSCRRSTRRSRRQGRRRTCRCPSGSVRGP